MAEDGRPAKAAKKALAEAQVEADEIDMIINTTEGKQAIKDSASIRRSAENHRVYYTTTLAAARAICVAVRFGQQQQVRRLQDLHGRIGA